MVALLSHAIWEDQTMSIRKTALVLSAATLAVGLSAVVGAGSAVLDLGMSAEAASGGLRCEIRSSRKSSGVALYAVVSSAAPASGTYRFTIRNGGSGGGSNINQAGDFSVDAGGESVVGEVSLGSGASYAAEFSVSSGKGASCRDRSSSWF